LNKLKKPFFTGADAGFWFDTVADTDTGAVSDDAGTDACFDTDACTGAELRSCGGIEI